MRPVQPSAQRGIDGDINALLHHLPRAPFIVQMQFIPYLQELYKEHPHSKLKQYLQNQPIQRYSMLQNFGHLVHNYTELLNPKQILHKIDKISQQLQQQQLKFQVPSKKKQPEVFDRIEMLYPQYDFYYRMSKQQQSRLVQYHPKTKVKDFFTEPRFLNRIQEYHHFKNNDQHKGNVAFLQYSGNMVAFGKVCLVSNQKGLELWGMESFNYPIPTLTIPTEEELEKKKEEEKKEKEKEESPPPPLKLQFMHKFTGHSQKITSISLSQDEYYAITGSADRTIRLWCLRMKVCIAMYRGHTKTIWDVNFSHSGYYFLSGSADGLMILWKTDEPHAQRIYQHQGDVYKVSFARDPSYVISAGEDTTIKIWSTIDATLSRKIKLCQPIINFTLGLSGAHLVAIQSDGRITLLNLHQGTTINSFYFYEPQRKKKEETLQQKTMKIHDACLSQDQRQLSCIGANYLLIYNMQKLQKKTVNNIYSFYKSNIQTEQIAVVEPKEVLYLGVQNNLTHCCYLSKNMLAIAGTLKL